MIKRFSLVCVLLLFGFLFSGRPVLGQGFEFWELTNWPIFQYIDDSYESFLLVPTGVDIAVREVDFPVHDGLLPVTAEWDIEIAGLSPLFSPVSFDVFVKTSNASASDESGWQMVAPDVKMPRGFTPGIVELPIPALIYLDSERPYLRSIRLVAHIDSGFAGEFCFPSCDASINMIRLVGAPAIPPTLTPTPTATNTPTATATPTAANWCEGLNDQKDTYNFAGSMDGWTLISGTSTGAGVAPVFTGGKWNLYISKAYAVQLSGFQFHFAAPAASKGIFAWSGVPDFATVRLNSTNAELDPAYNVAVFTSSGNLIFATENGPSTATLTGLTVCRYVPIITSTPTSTATPTATPLSCAPPTPGVGTATITPTATAGAGTSTAVPLPTCIPPSTPTITPTITSTSTPSRTPTPLGSATPTFVPPPGGTLPPSGGGTPGAPPMVPTPVLVMPTTVFTPSFGGVSNPCVAPVSSSFLFANYNCPAYQFPAWPGFTIAIWVYFSYLVQSLIALWGAAVCFFGSVFNWFIFVVNLGVVFLHLFSHLWCSMSVLLRLVGVFLSGLWAMITAFLSAATPGAAPTTFLGLDITGIILAVSTMLSNPYVGAVASVIFAVLSFSMWRQIVSNLSDGGKSE